MVYLSRLFRFGLFFCCLNVCLFESLCVWSRACLRVCFLNVSIVWLLDRLFDRVRLIVAFRCFFVWLIVVLFVCRFVCAFDRVIVRLAM